MPISLVALTAAMAALGVWGLLNPRSLFKFPVSSALMMLAYILPQAWQVNSSGDMVDLETDLTWSYMLLCMGMLTAGFYAGNTGAQQATGKIKSRYADSYDLDRVLVGAAVLCIVGTGAFILMRDLASQRNETLWTGALAFYYMIAQLTTLAGSLGLLIYLNTKKRIALIIALIGFGVNIPAIIFDARREQTFTVVTSILIGLYFVKGSTISRFILIPAILFGSLFITKAGEIRQYISSHDNTTIITALTDDSITGNAAYVRPSEVPSAVADITYATWDNEYRWFSPYIDTIVQLYVPAFILGREFKDSLKIGTASNDAENRFLLNGSTRTGFSDSFYSFHFLGAGVFFMIAFFMGRLWKNAVAGDMLSQLYYMALIPSALKILTESTSRFFGQLPLTFGAVAIIFYLSKRTTNKSNISANVGSKRLRAEPSINS